MDSLKKKRMEKKLTQIQMAIKLGVSLSTYRMWEVGVTKPNEENAKKIEEILNEK